MKIEVSGMAEKKRVLILCTGNSCRSKMAEGWIRVLLGDRWEARSAGTRPADCVHPLAVRAMEEVGIDISEGRPEPVDAHANQEWDLVVTVCDSARESCPVFPLPVERLHVSFFDPAEAGGTEEERLAVFRRIRDEIRERLLPAIDRRS